MSAAFKNYEAARRHAIKTARERIAQGADPRDADQGLSFNPVFREFTVWNLPREENRYGFETRCEVIRAGDPL